MVYGSRMASPAQGLEGQAPPKGIIMGIWQRLTGTEKRQEGGAYSDTIIALLQARSSGESALPGATAALEACSGFVSRAFASADVTMADSTMEGVLDPSTLGQIGRALIRSGEYCAVIRMDRQRGTLRLDPAASWDVQGGANPATWIYRLLISGPTQSDHD